MQGTMMDYPLTLMHILERACRIIPCSVLRMSPSRLWR